MLTTNLYDTKARQKSYIDLIETSSSSVYKMMSHFASRDAKDLTGKQMINAVNSKFSYKR